jgi:hypothetical protein
MERVNLQRLANAQKLFIWVVVAQILFLAVRRAWLMNMLPPGADAPLITASVVVGGAVLACLVMLLTSIPRSLPWVVLGVAAQVNPFTALLMLVLANQRATRALLEGGLVVGVTGARWDEAARSGSRGSGPSESAARRSRAGRAPATTRPRRAGRRGGGGSGASAGGARGSRGTRS